MTSCPKCGTENRPQARFCRGCREPLSGDTATCASCGTALRPAARFCRQCGRPVSSAAPRSKCPRCGRDLRPQAHFCAFCGTSLKTEVPSSKRFRCPNCGALVRRKARYCSKCSHPLRPTSERERGKQREISSPGPFGTGDLRPTHVLDGRYVILEKIAQGGMGAIYKAQDKRLRDRIVVVKEMTESALDEDIRSRILEAFQREARLLAHLEHPNLVKVTDRFQKGERHYMVMEFIEGQTLEEMLQGRTEPFSQERVLTWAAQLCDVLAFLHNQEPKIIYRDVKPANVMVMDEADQIKLIDFGIARFYKPGKKRDTFAFGTDGYAPPEQYNKGQTDEQSDLYALGATLHQLLTLHDPSTKPFDFPPMRKFGADVSPRVEAAIAKAVEGDPQKRHASASAMKEALLGDEYLLSEESKDEDELPALDLGKVLIADGPKEHAFEITLPAGERATLSTDVSWLEVSPRRVSESPCTVTATVDTDRLEPDCLRMNGSWWERWVSWHTSRLVPVARSLQGYVEITSKGQRGKKLPINVTAVPRQWQVAAGWLVTVGAMVLEVACGVGAVGVLVILLLSG